MGRPRDSGEVNMINVMSSLSHQKSLIYELCESYTRSHPFKVLLEVLAVFSEEFGFNM